MIQDPQGKTVLQKFIYFHKDFLTDLKMKLEKIRKSRLDGVFSGGWDNCLEVL